MSDYAENIENSEGNEVSARKPKLNKYWSYALTFSLLALLGVLFIQATEIKIGLLSISVSLIIVSLNKIISYDKVLADWYRENPDKIPDRMKKKKYRKSRRKTSAKLKK